MKSKSDRLPKFRTLEPAPGPITQTDPRIWIPKLHGFPCWFKPFSKEIVLHPMVTPRASEEARRQGIAPPFGVFPSDWTITELKSRENPWHPSGRLERVTMRLVMSGSTYEMTLKFYGEDEPIQCVQFTKLMPAVAFPIQGRYKGPRQTSDVSSAVTVNARKTT